MDAINKASNFREGWGAQIGALVSDSGDPAKEFNDMATAANDGLADLSWDGPTFETHNAGTLYICQKSPPKTEQ